MKVILSLWMLTVAVNMATGMQQSSSGRTQYFLINPDGSYKYAFDTNTGAFQEQQRGADGAVAGKYGFTGAGGSRVNVQYTAKGGTGQDGGAGYQTQHQSKTHYKQSNTGYSSGGNVGGGQGDYSLTLNPDGSYKYEYSLSDQSKAETRGSDGRVKGQFSFTDPTGQNRAISYTADEGGFQPYGDHIPVDGAQSSQQYGGSQSQYGGAQSQYGGAHSYGGGYSGGASAYGGSSGGAGGSGDYKLRLGPNGQYEYSYSLSDQSKSEVLGADGKVKGQFSFTDPTGQNRAITYTADERGFLPQGDHIPQPSQEFYDAHQKASGYGGGYGSSYGGDSGGDYYSGSVGGGIAGDGAYGQSSFPSNYGGGNAGYGGGAGAGSYSFDYNTADHSHSQSGQGMSVSGQYSALSEGGSQKVTYDANGGYKPIVQVQTKVGGGKSSHTSGARYGSGSSHSGSKYGSHGSSGLVGSTDHSGGGESWSYQYTAGGHDHQQTGSSGQAQGQYNVQSAGGSQQSTYSAGKGGFMPTHNINIKLGAGGKKSGSHY